MIILVRQNLVYVVPEKKDFDLIWFDLIKCCFGFGFFLIQTTALNCFAPHQFNCFDFMFVLFVLFLFSIRTFRLRWYHCSVRKSLLIDFYIEVQSTWLQLSMMIYIFSECDAMVNGEMHNGRRTQPTANWSYKNFTDFLGGS